MFININNNLKDIFKNIQINKNDYSYTEAVVTLFIYEKFNKENVYLLNTFIKSHLKFNNNTMIFIFTNMKMSKTNLSKRVKIIYFPFTKEKLMSYRVAFNYNIILKFKDYKKIYILDTDIIAIKDYNYLSHEKFDVGVTICNNWPKRKKFPVNAGFLLIQNSNKQNIINFAKLYISSYTSVLSNMKFIINNSKFNHLYYKEHITDLEEWWGDQYLFFVLFNFEFPKKILNFLDTINNNIKYRFFNESIYNLQSATLKKASMDFDLLSFLNERKNLFFLHLTGPRKKFAYKLLEIFDR